MNGSAFKGEGGSICQNWSSFFWKKKSSKWEFTGIHFYRYYINCLGTYNIPYTDRVYIWNCHRCFIPLYVCNEKLFLVLYFLLQFLSFMAIQLTSVVNSLFYDCTQWMENKYWKMIHVLQVCCYSDWMASAALHLE